MEDAHAQLEADVAALEELPVFIAYNANVDAIVRVDEELESFLERPTEPGSGLPSSPLASKRELAAAIAHTMAAGRGDEVAMADEFAATLEAELEPDSQQMGGQAGIMTNLLTALGTAPITYTYLISERQLSMFDHPDEVQYPTVEDDEVGYVPLTEAINTERTKINWVFEFREGDEFFGVTAPEDTRFIAASRPPEFDLSAGDLDEAIDQVGEVVDGALLAGYHNLTPDHVEEGYEETHKHAREVIRRLRSESDVDVHVEYAVTHDDDLRESMYEWILPEANVVGADTHELTMLHDDAGIEAVEEPPSEATPFEPEEILEHYRMLEAVREELSVDCLQLHAMEYHLAVMESYHSPEALRRGLEFSAVNAATKAALGHISEPEDLETGLGYDPSMKGREAIELLADHVGEMADDGVLETPTVAACPNRVVDEPAGTVGIGDIVSSSSFVLELAVASDR
ncbi:ADP-dependent glucokinase/phosphofructokinase [Natronobacterium gregoryi]|uniref:Phosphofructokinase n=2 Tax=Natronobacterium gregoryi TaxID=44930 RepID=L0ALG8_NATGS|nr:ADP-dependent glucokinase/phosphofructokinase [Natronobacterium gregoryi]AFZ74037.1 archaeal ADP-dependent phosphofructokinase/glucokinase [Natronobacterium gregoryi SP2]ELY70538.1 ADP-specific phosphofructokinase [Natronobacterium gregoryi SP2]PLK20784.1 phosphofructokinase [Natronobacterium gregoryi SP2]SFJ07098.1 ADP-dependent phosphofructokinase/glucokinase [Natronobacterium gregoryi]